MPKKAETDDIVPLIAPRELTSKQFLLSWARLIRKIHAVDPLCCPNCQYQNRVAAFLEASLIVKKILEHFDL